MHPNEAFPVHVDQAKIQVAFLLWLHGSAGLVFGDIHFNGEQKGKTSELLFIPEERFPPICCGWQRTLKRKLNPASPAFKKKKRKVRPTYSHYHLCCLSSLMAAALIQGLNHTLLNSHGRPGNTDATV